MANDSDHSGQGGLRIGQVRTGQALSLLVYGDVGTCFCASALVPL